jgi:hypothetical protein
MEGNHGDMSARYRRPAGLALLTAVAAIVPAGCGGARARSVANLATTTPATVTGRGAGGSGHGTSTTAASSSDPARLLDDWAACMRRHGDPNQIDPSIDSHKLIVIPWDASIPGGYNGTYKGGHGNSGPGQYCRTYLSKAQSALRGGRAEQQPSNAQLVEFAGCMRAHGIHDFPDPTGSGLHFNVSGDLSPDNPAFQSASNVCSKQAGVPGLGNPPPGTITLTNA